MSQAEVFIVESLKFADESKERFEGRIISQVLGLSGKKCQYCYVRTKRELKVVMRRFSRSEYRYLHLSCHGNESSMSTTLDIIPFPEFADIVKPHLRNRRLFLSACGMTNRALADEIMPDSGCYSILGPGQEIRFSDAAVLWASFYHVMFSADRAAMKHRVLRAKAQEVANMFAVALTLIDNDRGECRVGSIAPHGESREG